MKSTTFAVAAAAIFVFAQSAQAHEYHHRHARHHVARYRSPDARREASMSGQFPFAFSWSSGMGSAAYASGMSENPGPRPSAWCGWEMRRLVGADPGPSYNLARNWVHWGHSGPAGIGAVVVWPHHVGKIVGQENGQWIVESGNDGHALRSRARSIAGAIAIRWS